MAVYPKDVSVDLEPSMYRANIATLVFSVARGGAIRKPSVPIDYFTGKAAENRVHDCPNGRPESTNVAVLANF